MHIPGGPDGGTSGALHPLPAAGATHYHLGGPSPRRQYYPELVLYCRCGDAALGSLCERYFGDEGGTPPHVAPRRNARERP